MDKLTGTFSILKLNNRNWIRNLLGLKDYKSYPLIILCHSGNRPTDGIAQPHRYNPYHSLHRRMKIDVLSTWQHLDVTR